VPARGEVIPAREMLRGTAMTADACARTHNAVRAMVYGHGFCMRYCFSTAGGNRGGRRPHTRMGIST